ncbi:MAG: ArsR/SmtB family transcription factor [Candidatus Helarchaeota archaeon]
MSDDEKYKQLKTLMECRGDLENPEKYIEELQELTRNFGSAPEFKKILKINKVLSEKHRLIMLEIILKKGDICICELSNAWGFKNLSQPTISHHIQKLEDVGLIEGIKSGKFIHYRIKKEEIQNYLEILKKIFETKHKRAKERK